MAWGFFLAEGLPACACPVAADMLFAAHGGWPIAVLAALREAV